MHVHYSLSNSSCFVIDGTDVLYPGENVIRIRFKPNA